MDILNRFRSKKVEKPVVKPLEPDWKDVLSECVVRIDSLERQVSKLYKRQQGKPLIPLPNHGENVMKETEKYIIYKDGSIKYK